ncbi:MAG: hypothetical protein KF866_05615 [Phycisphaeraceae bacterium]|nr:hypothetical protein [Phycisphaeraceae bacterium]MCW5754471.1 hypothetical protein [Phycisphaeraceae bacterium]
MQVYLDDVPLDIAEPSLAAALREAVLRAQGQGRMVVEVKGDGRLLGEAELAQPSRDTGGYGELRITSAEPRALVCITLRDAAEALDGVEADQTEAALLIQSGKLDEARALFERAVQTWQAIMTALAHGAELLQLDLARLAPASGGPSVGQRLSELIDRLKLLVVAMTREDWSSLADALEFDMRDQADAWKSMLTDLARSLAPSAGGPV